MNDVDDEHSISISDHSLLKEVIGSSSANINGAHHQAIGKLSDELIATAISEDGVIEAAEFKEKEGESWMMAVQWHPERMKDRETNPASKNIREAFFKEVKRNRK
jgi:putative glutamine amidotransferase